MIPTQMTLPVTLINQFCQRWRIIEFALFGSILRPDFRADSDVDVLVTFQPEAHWTLFDLVYMQEELKAMLGRPVDLIERAGVEASRNPIRRAAILDSAQVICTSIRN